MHKRLKEERTRIGVTQKELANIGGVWPIAQTIYEKGIFTPSKKYFIALIEHGVDVTYIITGERAISIEELTKIKENFYKCVEEAEVWLKENNQTLTSEQIIKKALDYYKKIYENSTIISVAQDFSESPSARYNSDSPNSGERFRDEILIPQLKQKELVIVQLDSSFGFGASFLEEVFGGLVRKGYTYDDLEERLIIESPLVNTYKNKAWQYIKEAARKSN